jgi:gliding motility-associated lipoprotein GldH
MTEYNHKPARLLHLSLIFILSFLSACTMEKPDVQRIYFPSGSWQRYNILKFNLPVVESERSYDIIFELRCRKSFIYDDLPLNMVLNTPSGEERIKEYQVQIRDKNGIPAGILNGDTCTTRIFLKKSLNCSKKGALKIEIENLNPRMETEGIFSAGIILVRH